MRILYTLTIWLQRAFHNTRSVVKAVHSFLNLSHKGTQFCNIYIFHSIPSQKRGCFKILSSSWYIQHNGSTLKTLMKCEKSIQFSWIMPHPNIATNVTSDIKMIDIGQLLLYLPYKGLTFSIFIFLIVQVGKEIFQRPPRKPVMWIFEYFFHGLTIARKIYFFKIFFKGPLLKKFKIYFLGPSVDKNVDFFTIFFKDYPELERGFFNILRDNPKPVSWIF